MIEIQEISSSKGFTLVELLVVISIIGLLSSVVLISVTRARALARDTRRVQDLKAINTAFQLYVQNGNTPQPVYATPRLNSSPGFWDGWWDLSTNVSNGSFMDFLQTSGVMAKVPVDPLNTPLGHNGQPHNPGNRYVYYVVPAGYIYQGGTCQNAANVYMLAITDLETEPRPPTNKFTEGRCDCLWTNAPDFFRSYFDYTICGTF